MADHPSFALTRIAVTLGRILTTESRTTEQLISVHLALAFSRHQERLVAFENKRSKGHCETAA